MRLSAGCRDHDDWIACRRGEGRSARVAEAESKKKLESLAGNVSGLEKRLKLVERYMEEVRENMDRKSLLRYSKLVRR